MPEAVLGMNAICRCAMIVGVAAVAASTAGMAAAQQGGVATVRPDAELAAAPLVPVARFGEGLAGSGDLLLVGAPGLEPAGTDSGAAVLHRYERSTNRWAVIGLLEPSGAAPDDEFGSAVAVSRAVAAVGSTGAGFVAIFSAQAGWAETHRIEPIGGGGPDFGSALTLGDGWLAVGEPQRSGSPGPGRVHLFRLTDQGDWTPGPVLESPSGSVADAFGTAVAMRDGVLVVGAPGASGGGRAFVYRRQPDPDIFPGRKGQELESWRLSAELAASAGAAGERFGSSVAVSDRLIVVGVEGADDAAANAGAVDVFPAVNGQPLGGSVRLLPPDAEPAMLFGASVSAEADLIAVGAPLAGGFAGRAFAYRVRPGEQAELVGTFAGESPMQGDRTGDAVHVGPELLAVTSPGLDPAPLLADAGLVGVYRTLPLLGLGGDCNANGVSDVVDILVTRTAIDCNGNGLPDTCEVAADPSLDADGDGRLDACDNGDCPADQNFDGQLTDSDFFAWLTNYTNGCP